MNATTRKSRNIFRIAMSPRHVIVTFLLAAFASIAPAQCPLPPNPDETYPSPPLTYPLPSTRYAVQYRVNGGIWTEANVFISQYGGTNASPSISFSPYGPNESQSFVSIPAGANANVQLQVTKLWDGSFRESDHVSVRPGVKQIESYVMSDGTVEISANTDGNFSGEQFMLWWSRGADGGGVEALAFYLNPPYERPMGPTVKIIVTQSDLDDVTANPTLYDTLDFEGFIAIKGTGAQAYAVPGTINTIYLGPDAWVQGKLHFEQSGSGNQRKVYGPGVLGLSRFHYNYRVCDAASNFPDEGYDAISWDDPLAGTTADTYLLDGFIVSDQNHAVTELLLNGVVNNTKTLGWNGVNGGFRLGDHTTATNLYVRAADDSLMMWGSHVTVTNATVWQNYNGGVVNLGWLDNSTGDGNLIDGLYVVKTDWIAPTATQPSWMNTDLNNQNDAVIASLMSPGTKYVTVTPALFQNIFVEDAPQVLFSIKILPPDCGLNGLFGTCPGAVDLT